MDPWKYPPYFTGASSRGYIGPGHAVRTTNNNQPNYDQDMLVASSEPKSFDNPCFTQQSLPDVHHTSQQERCEKILKPPGLIEKMAVDCITEPEMNQPEANRLTTPPGLKNFIHQEDRIYDVDGGLHRYSGFGQDQASPNEVLERLMVHSAPCNFDEESQRMYVKCTAEILSARDKDGLSPCNETKSGFMNLNKEESHQQATNRKPIKPPPGFGFEISKDDKPDTGILSIKGAPCNDDKPENKFRHKGYVDRDSEKEYRADIKFEADTQKAIARSKQDQSKETFLETDIDLAFALYKQDSNTRLETSSKGSDSLKNDYSRESEQSHKKREKEYQEDIERAMKASYETLKTEKQNVNIDVDAHLSSPCKTSFNNEQSSGIELKEMASVSDKKRQEAISKAKKWTTHDIDYYDYRNDKEYQSAVEKYVYFWRNHDIYSQWHKSKFYVNGIKFNCAEQFMMYKKAELFEDKKVAKKILGEKDPRRIKALGREVKGFSEEMWAHNCLHIVKDANIAKFSQDAKMKEELYSTYPRILVEASPYDKIWGIGFSEEDCEAWDEKKWKGKNWLGYILTEVRDEMMATEGVIEQRHKKVYLESLLEMELKKYKSHPDTTPKEKNQNFSDFPNQEKKTKNKNAKIKNVKDTENNSTRNSKTGKIGTEFRREGKFSFDQINPELKEHEKEMSTHKQGLETTHKQELDTHQQDEATKLVKLDKYEGDTETKPELRNQSLEGHILHNLEKEGNLETLDENDQARQDKSQDKSSAGYGQNSSVKLTELVDDFSGFQPENQDMDVENIDITLGSFESVNEANTGEIDESGICDKPPIPHSCWTESTLVNRDNDKHGPLGSFEESSDNGNANNLVEETASENNDWELI